MPDPAEDGDSESEYYSGHLKIHHSMRFMRTFDEFATLALSNRNSLYTESTDFAKSRIDRIPSRSGRKSLISSLSKSSSSSSWSQIASVARTSNIRTSRPGMLDSKML